MNELKTVAKVSINLAILVFVYNFTFPVSVLWHFELAYFLIFKPQACKKGLRGNGGGKEVITIVAKQPFYEITARNF